jgi:hypothetical protein
MTVEACWIRRHPDSEIRDITVPDFTAPQSALEHAACSPRAHRTGVPDGCRGSQRDSGTGPGILTH